MCGYVPRARFRSLRSVGGESQGQSPEDNHRRVKKQLSLKSWDRKRRGEAKGPDVFVIDVKGRKVLLEDGEKFERDLRTQTDASNATNSEIIEQQRGFSPPLRFDTPPDNWFTLYMEADGTPSNDFISKPSGKLNTAIAAYYLNHHQRAWYKRWQHNPRPSQVYITNYSHP